MKLFSILLGLCLMAMPVQASKVLSISFHNVTGEDVQFKSLHLKNGTFLQSFPEEGNYMIPSRGFSFYVEHQDEDFEDMRDKRWIPSLEEDNYIMLQIKGIEFPLYWKACILTYYNTPEFIYTYAGGNTENFRIGFSVKRGARSVLIKDKRYIPYYIFAGVLGKIQ